MPPDGGLLYGLGVADLRADPRLFCMPITRLKRPLGRNCGITQLGLVRRGGCCGTKCRALDFRLLLMFLGSRITLFVYTFEGCVYRFLTVLIAFYSTRHFQAYAAPGKPDSRY